MAEWERRFKLGLDQDARDRWKNRMVQLADKLIQVALKNPEAFQDGAA